MAGNQITFGVGFNVNEAGLNKLKQSLKDIQQLTSKDLMSSGKFANLTQAEAELKKIKQSATDVQNALNRAFNASLGTTNVAKFNAELQKLNLNAIAQQFNSAGAAGQIAFNNLAASVMTSNVKLKQTYSLLENFKTTLTNTVKWNIAAGAINSFTHSISSAFNYVKALDASLTDIRIVTGQSRDEMASFAVEANNAAQALGRQTKEYTNAALAFYQQGLNADEVRVRTEASLKAQNITGAGTEIVDELTAVWNGFKVTIADTELYVDKLAAVADSSASNLSELATGMSKAASVANNMGVSMDQLTAQLATIIATTRQAPQTVGNALKTIYARINDIKAGTDEAEISLGNYTSKMASLGINVLDASGRLRETGEVMEEIGSKWTSMTREQQVYLAQTMAGQRQMNNLVSLFDNWEKYSEMLNVSLNAQGALNEKNARYMDSISAHINQFKAATEGLQDALIDEEAIKKVVDAGTSLVNMFNNILTSIGGIKTAGLALSGVLLNAFSSNIASGISGFIINLQNAKENAQQLVTEFQILQQFGETGGAVVSQLKEWAMTANQLQQSGVMSGEERNAVNALMQQYTEIKNQSTAWEEAKTAAENYYNAIKVETQNSADINSQNKGVQSEQFRTLKIQKEYYQDLQNEVQAYQAQIKNVQAAEDHYDKSITSTVQNYEEQWEKLLDNLYAVKQAFEEIDQNGGESFGLSSDQVEQVRAQLNNLKADLSSNQEITSYADKYFTFFRQIIAGAQDTNQRVVQTFKQGASDIESTLATEGDAIQQQINNFFNTKTLQQNIQGFVQVLGGLAGFASGLKSIESGIKAIGDESLSATEKVSRVLIAFSMGASMITMGISKMRKGSVLLSSGLQALSAKLIAATLAEQGLSQEQINRILVSQLEISTNKSLAASLYNVAAAFLASPYAVFIPIIAAAAATVWALVKAFTADAKAVQEANKQASEAKTRYQEVKEAYEDLKSSLEDYQAAQNAIDELTIGTQEWRDAIAEANQQVLELLANYPELAEYIKNTNGRLTISAAGQNAAKQAASARVDFAQNTYLNAQNIARQKSLDQEIQQAAAKLGVSAGALQQGLQARQALIAAGEKVTIENLTNALANVEVTDQNLIKMLVENRSELTKLDASIQANTKATEITNQQQMHEYNEKQNNAAYTQSKYQQAIDEMMSADLADAKQQALYRRNAQLDRTVHQAYADQMGYTYAGNGKGVGNFINQQGQQISVDDNAIRQALAFSDALNEVGSSLQKYVETFNNITKDMNDAQKNAIATFAGGKVGDFGDIVAEDIDAMVTLVEYHWKELGFATQAAATKAAEQARGAYEQFTNTVLNSFVKTVRNVLTSEDFVDLSPSDKKAVGAALSKAYGEAGREGLESMAELFREAQKQGVDLGNLADILEDIDWQTANIEDLSEILEVAGIATQGFQSPLEKVIELMKTAAGIDLDTATNKYKEAMDVAQDLHYGDGISAEDYQKLAAYDIPGLREMFQFNERGEYEFYGSAKQLVDAINDLSFEEFKAGAEAATASTEKLNEVLEARGTSDLTGLEGRSSNIDIQRQQLAVIEAAGLEGKDRTRYWGENLGTVSTANELAEAMGRVLQQYSDINQLIASNEEEQANWNDIIRGTGEALDEDINREEFEELADYLEEYGGALYGISQDLKGNHKAATEVAEDFLRAKAATEAVEKNIEEWNEAFKDPTKDIQKYVNSVTKAENAYKDLLNLDNNAKLSEEFITSAENLKLMQEAINGSEAAYQQLSDAAQRDLVSQGLETIIKLNPEVSDEDIAALEDNLMQHINDIENSIDDIEVGTDLNDGDFLAELDNIINAAGMTAEQATALLASMGIDAEVVEGEPTESQSTQSAQAYTGPTYTTQQIDFGGPMGGGVFTYPQLVSEGTWTPVTSSNTDSSPRPFALHVQSATKGVGSGGNINSKKLGGGGGGKKGGGGGGGGSKAKKPNKPMKAKIDPYHDVNIKIGDTQEAIDKLQKERDKLIGKDAVDNLTKQINLMEKEKKLLQEKAKIADQELQRQRKELANLGASFNANGDIANYKQLLLNKQNQINKAIKIGNKLEGEEREAYDEYIKDLEQQYKDLESAIKEYDETMQLVDDLEADYQDLINDQIKLAIEAFDLKINVELDLKDAEKEFNEFRKKVIDKIKDDDFAGLAQNTAQGYASYYNVDENGVAGGLINDLRTHAQDIQREIQIITNGGFSQVYGNDLAAAADDLKNYNDELMKALEEAQEVIDETHDHFLDAIDAMNDAFDTQQENFDKLDDLLSHDMEILQLIHGEENYDELANLWQQQVNQDNVRLQALQTQQQYWQDKLNEYEKDTDEWKKAMENWQAAFEATNEAMITSVQNLQSQWENSINSIMASLRNETFGGNMDAALEDWDKMTWHSERYLDSIDRANGLLELQNKYIDMINKTNDPKLQAQLAELEEKQLDALANKEHLREIDLKLAQQQLTVLQAQMALEDAQQAKTKLRLRRDSQGNYTYQYVADEDNIQEKTQDYLKALNDYRTTANESLHQDLEDLRDYTLEYYDALQEAQMKYGDNTEALLAEQDRLYEMYFGDPDGYITALHNDALSSMTDAQEAMFANLYGLNNTLSQDLFEKFLGPDSEMVAAAYDVLGAGGEVPSLLDAFVNDSAKTAFENIQDMTQETLSGDHGLLPEWSSALWNIAEQYDNDFVPRVVEAMNYLQQSNQAYVDGLAIMQESANRTTENIALGLAYDTAYTNALDEATQALLDTQMAQVEASEQVYNALKKNEEAFQDQTQAAIDAANAMYLYWLALNGKTSSALPYSLTGTDSKVKTTTTPVKDSTGYTTADGAHHGGGTTQSSTSTTSNQTASLFTLNNASAGARYATGGYTGAWSSDPKLAWLDQKELVLNADDTSNILSAVDIVRAIAEKVGSIAGTATAGIKSGSALDLVAAAGQTILQDVIINADFPAVQDAAQIKQAFNELVNLASQRASGNRRTY